MMRFAPLLVFLALAVVFGAALLSGGAARPPDAMVGRAVPDTAIDGLDHALLAKGVVIVNFFASWCAPCAEEQPVLARMADTLRAKIIGIAYKDTRPRIADWLAEHGNPFAAIGYDAAGRAAIDWGVYGVPETFVVVNGVIRHRHVGPLDDAAVAQIAALAQGKEKP